MNPNDPKNVDKHLNKEKFLVAQPALSCSPGLTSVFHNNKMYTSNEK